MNIHKLFVEIFSFQYCYACLGNTVCKEQPELSCMLKTETTEVTELISIPKRPKAYTVFLLQLYSFYEPPSLVPPVLSALADKHPPHFSWTNRFSSQL